MTLNTKKACYSLRYYRKILESLKEHFDAHYVVSEIPQIFSQISRPKFIIRHDIHQSLINGLELAKIEKELSVRTSYMIDVLSPDLDLNKKENASLLQEIINLGHEVGLYVFHSSPESEDPKTLGFDADKIISQSRHLEALIRKRIYSVSFQKEYSNIPEDSFFIGQKVSASSKILMEESLSDINDLENHHMFLSKIKKRDKKILQILIHPELWCKD